MDPNPGIDSRVAGDSLDGCRAAHWNTTSGLASCRDSLLRPRDRMFCFGILVFLLCGCRGDEATAPKDAVEPAVPVETAKIQRQTVPVYGVYVGRTDANATVEIRARVEGFLQEALFKEGSQITKGQKLFQIDPRPFEAALQSANAQWAKAQAQLEFSRQRTGVLKARAGVAESQSKLALTSTNEKRYRTLLGQDVVAQLEYDKAAADEEAAIASMEAATATLKNAEVSETYSIDEAEANVQAAKAAVQKAQLDLGYTIIHSPIGGIAGRLEIDTGNLVGRGESTRLVTISSSDPIYVLFNVSETDYLRLRRKYGVIGKPAINQGARSPDFELILADNSPYPHKGRFSLVERAVDPKTGTLMVRAEFPNPGGFLRPGQFVRVRIQIDQLPDAVLVPERAIAEVQAAQSVLVVGPQNKVQLRTITTGERHGRSLVVRSGLQGGETVVVEGRQKVRPGMTVRPIPAASGTAMPTKDW